MDVLKGIIIAVVAYALGNISTGALLAKRAHVDLRSQNSGNIGATNTLRVLGKAAGLLTLLGDALKGVLSVGLGVYLLDHLGGLIAGISVILGHVFPALFKFKGGKGIATAVGVLLVLQPFYIFMILLVCIPLIVITRYVSLAAIAGVILLFVLNICLNIYNVPDWLFAFFLCALVLYTHRQNIQRLMTGTENPISLRRKA